MEDRDDNATCFPLPKELLVHILQFVRTPQTIGLCCSTVCRRWQEASAEPLLWKGMAMDRFGAAIISPSNDDIVNQYYQGDYKLLLQDDCQEAAVPTICPAVRVCWWKRNGQPGVAPQFATFNRSYYACWIECIKWDRQRKTIRIYLDVRGETDLRKVC